MTRYVVKLKLMLFLSMTILTLAASSNATTSSSAFDDSIKPPAPDYSLATSWAALPDIPGASSAVPVSSSPAIKKSNVDVFYVHPTTLKDRTQWNQELSDSKTNAWTDVSVIARQASVFNHCCEIYAPRYRQASFKAGGDTELKGDGGKAYKLAYSDVLRAFDYYIKNNNHGRPFILAGHSQGALMVYWLLRDRIDDSPLKNKLVVSYIIGIDLMQGDFGRTYQSLKLCLTPEQTGCILAWNAGNKDFNIDMMKEYAGSRYAYRYATQEGRQAVCVNPLTFDTSKPNAPASYSKGAVPGAPGDGALKALKAGAVSARCDRGYLIVESAPALDLSPLPGGSMHYHEFGLFYADIRENLAVRIRHFLNTNQ